MTQDQHIPIDIHATKLVDWLQSRRHVKKNWSDSIQDVRKKLNNAIQDMPEHPEITKLLSGSYINYFHCLQIVDILKETEKDSKNIFGWYTSQRMKDWQEVIKLYQYDNLYLVEASQYFVRNVAYEMPSLRRTISKAKQMQTDCDTRENEYRKNAANAKQRYYTACLQMGLKGENVKAELMDLLTELPAEFEKIAKLAKPLKEAISFYKDFTNFICPTLQSSPAPLTSFIIDNGNVTVYEWKYGEAPIEVKVHEDKEENGFVVVDSPDSESGIDFGDEDLSTGEIDWGTLDTPPVDEGATIDWNITEVDKTDCSNIVIESSGLQGGVAEGDEALTLLDNKATRSTFVNELLELKGFLMQRKVEMDATETVLSMSQFTNAPKSIQYQNVKNVISYLSVISDIIDNLSSTKMQHLYLISLSSKYVDRFAESLCAKLRESDKLEESVLNVVSKRKKAILDEQKLSIQLKQILSRSKELQSKIERDISSKYNNRRVNLMGAN